MQFHIHLREGFENDSFILSLNGEEVVREEGVSTNYAINLARMKTVDVSPGPYLLRIEVPTRKLRHTEELQITAEVYLAIDLLDQQLHTTLQAEPFQYM